mmetsp:Transcript_6527/g.5603  ORF Transcript_6527/g.5603 Transcript_6527/m.5603 type:complete len:242 (+) Transcript_6527:3-728(+)
MHKPKSLKKQKKSCFGPFDNQKLDQGEQKIKGLRFICRGGLSIDRNAIIINNLKNNSSEMEVDSRQTKYINENDYEETKKKEETAQKNTVSRLSSVRIDYKNKSGSSNDHSKAMDYITLIQTVQRKRRFTEISNEIRQQQNSEIPESTNSRQEISLDNNTKNDDFPGKFIPNVLNLTRASIETEESPSNFNSEYELGNLLNSTHRRLKTLEVADDSERLRDIDFDSARRERDLNRINLTRD